MKKLAITLTATVLMLATTPLMAYAQSQGAGAASVHALAQNAPPIVKQVACNGRLGPFCRPGWFRVCRPGSFTACWCARCRGRL